MNTDRTLENHAKIMWRPIFNFEYLPCILIFLDAVFLQMKGQLIAISKIEKYFFQFWVFWAKIDNAQNDPKMGNFHGTRTRVLKDTRCRILWQMNAFEIYFVHLHYYLNLSKYILSCVKSSNPTFGPENSPKWPKNTLK